MSVAAVNPAQSPMTWGEYAPDYSPSKFRTIGIIWEQISTIITDLIPNAIKWRWRVYQQAITSISLETTADKVNQQAVLYLHGKLNSEVTKKPAILLLHGDRSYPFTLLPYADLAEKQTKAPIFSLYVPHDANDQQVYGQALKQAIDKIEQLMEEKGGFSGIIAVGHSRGAIESAYAAFVDGDQRIKGEISLAGRLSSVISPVHTCPDELKPRLDKITQGVKDHPEIPLYQIFGTKDWNAPIEAMALRPDSEHCVMVSGARHLDVLYTKMAQQCYVKFLNRLVYSSSR